MATFTILPNLSLLLDLLFYFDKFTPQSAAYSCPSSSLSPCSPFSFFFPGRWGRRSKALLFSLSASPCIKFRAKALSILDLFRSFLCPLWSLIANSSNLLRFCGDFVLWVFPKIGNFWRMFFYFNLISCWNSILGLGYVRNWNSWKGVLWVFWVCVIWCWFRDFDWNFWLIGASYLIKIRFLRHC